jgi:hypothetical protein
VTVTTMQHILAVRHTFCVPTVCFCRTPGALPAPEAAASVLKQLRRIRRRLATGHLQLVSSAWLTDSLTTAAGDGPGGAALRRRPEMLYTPAVLRQALSSAVQPPEAAAAAAGGGGTAAGQHGAEEQQPGAKQQGGVWSWPWDVVGLGDSTAGSSSDSDGGEQLGCTQTTGVPRSTSTTRVILLCLPPILCLEGCMQQRHMVWSKVSRSLIYSVRE